MTYSLEAKSGYNLKILGLNFVPFLVRIVYGYIKKVKFSYNARHSVVFQCVSMSLPTNFTHSYD